MKKTKTKRKADDGVAFWPADSVERRAIDELVPYARNARTHPPEQIAQVAASIREFGWTMPILVDEVGTIIAGHCRLEAARQLGFDEVPVTVAKGWSETKRRAYVLADNRLALDAGWDEDLLRVELSDLDLEDFNLELTGFNEKELSTHLADDEFGPTGLSPQDDLSTLTPKICPHCGGTL